MERLSKKDRHILQQKLCDMKRRCNNPADKSYKDYGGRGIKVCPEWSDPKNGHENFRKWAIENGWKKGLSIDRENNDGDYEPSNCRWATPKQQSNNTRFNRLVTIKGQTKTIQEWADIVGITQRSMTGRIEAGWSQEDLLKPRYNPLKMTKAEMSKEIRMWRDLEEQNKLLKLPCAVGDIIWDIDFGRPCGYEVTGFSFGSLNDDDWEEEKVLDKAVVYYTNSNGSITGTFAVSEIGKTVFLTREEAEATLEELERG